MSDPASLLAWRDALLDMGLSALVPPPGEPEAVVAPVAESVPVAFQRPVPALPEPRPERRPVAPPQIEVPAARVFTVPKDPVGNPPAEAVGAAGNLADLERCIQGCHACPLGAGRIRFVFGEGNPAADLMFIGEGPGKDEDLQGRPFVGKAGELLDKMISSIGFQRDQVYIANVVKCRPPDNRTPLPEEAARCLPYLRRQIELVRPRVIVTLGATPLRELLGVTTGITRVRGQWQRLEQLGGIPVMPTFHPAYVLRQYTQDVRRAVYQDLLAAKGWLEQHPA